LHLGLAGAAPTGDSFLHLVRGVLDDLAAGRRCLCQREAAGLPDAHGCPHVDLEEDVLDGHHVRPQLGQDQRQLGPQLGEAGRERVRR
jgi:hypothetical protein